MCQKCLLLNSHHCHRLEFHFDSHVCPNRAVKSDNNQMESQIGYSQRHQNAAQNDAKIIVQTWHNVDCNGSNKCQSGELKNAFVLSK